MKRLFQTQDNDSGELKALCNKVNVLENKISIINKQNDKILMYMEEIRNLIRYIKNT